MAPLLKDHWQRCRKRGSTTAAKGWHEVGGELARLHAIDVPQEMLITTRTSRVGLDRHVVRDLCRGSELSMAPAQRLFHAYAQRDEHRGDAGGDPTIIQHHVHAVQVDDGAIC